MFNINRLFLVAKIWGTLRTSLFQSVRLRSTVTHAVFLAMLVALFTSAAFHRPHWFYRAIFLFLIFPFNIDFWFRPLSLSLKSNARSLVKRLSVWVNRNRIDFNCAAHWAFYGFSFWRFRYLRNVEFDLTLRSFLFYSCFVAFWRLDDTNRLFYFLAFDHSLSEWFFWLWLGVVLLPWIHFVCQIHSQIFLSSLRLALFSCFFLFLMRVNNALVLNKFCNFVLKSLSLELH